MCHTVGDGQKVGRLEAMGVELVPQFVNAIQVDPLRSKGSESTLDCPCMPDVDEASQSLCFHHRKDRQSDPSVPSNW